MQLERCDRQNEIERLSQENTQWARRMEVAISEQGELYVGAG